VVRKLTEPATKRIYMTIDGLIERLKKYPPDTRVWEYDIVIQDPKEASYDYTLHLQFDGVL
jgi:hypothetical protein